MPNLTLRKSTQATPRESTSTQATPRESTSTQATPPQRRTGAFHGRRSAQKYWIILGVMSALALFFIVALLSYGNPMPFGSDRFWLIAERRLNAVIAMVIVAFCQSIATVAFQTVTQNRIITPSIMGFESLYVALHTTTVYVLGVTGLMEARTLSTFLLQLVLMVGCSLALYGWLLGGNRGNMHAMLLVGIVIGAGLGSVSTFMQRLLTPSEFDVLTARLFGSVNNADAEYYPIALPLIVVAGGLILASSRKLNVLALGSDTTTNLGLSHKNLSIAVLVLVTVLMAVSTALVGPMAFLGFLVATLAYHCADTYDHRYIFPMAFLIGIVVMTSAYFVMNHIFYAQGVVSIVIKLLGGTVFLLTLVKKSSL